MFGKKKNEDYSVKTVKVGVDKLTTIALGTMVKGTITVEGDLRLDGIIEGNVSCRGKVVIGPQGRIDRQNLRLGNPHVISAEHHAEEGEKDAVGAPVQVIRRGVVNLRGLDDIPQDDGRKILGGGEQNHRQGQHEITTLDQLEKANLFLQGIIDTRLKPMDDKMVEWLFKNPIGDGGQFTGVSDILTKYGVVPAEVMVETNSSNSTGRMSNLIGLKLKEYGLQLRDLSTTKGTTVADLEKKKTEMLGTIYRMLVLNLGEPPTKFTWTRKDAKGNPVETKEYTPQSFFQEYIGDDLKNNYVMLMNDPSRDYYKLYEIDYDRHAYDGKNWTYVNLPIEDIKQMAIASIKDSTMMYFSCDVGKFFDRDRGILDVNFYDYGSLMGTTFGMDKKQRIQTFASGSSHAMTLMAVDLDANGKPKKWMVENSWGPGANAGHLIMTDQWFNEYMFRLVVNKKYITDQVKEILKQTPTRLPAWDPMFAEED